MDREKPAETAKLAEAHDVLLIPPIYPPERKNSDDRPQMLRMEIKEDGSYRASSWLELEETGARKLYSIARPARPEEPQRGPGFAILPIRPEAGSQFNTCFLINTENLLLPNPWTAAYWDAPDHTGTFPAQSSDPRADDSSARAGFELLVAASRGRVFHVVGGDVEGTITPIDMSKEPEIWGQLREGLIVGTVMCISLGRILPIVNPIGLKVEKSTANVPVPDGRKP